MTSESGKKEVNVYIMGFPENVQVILTKFRRVISEAAPNAKETINYGIPTFKLNGNLVHYAAFKEHIGFYPTPSGIKAFEKELSPYKTSKGAVQFPYAKPIPYDLIKKIVKYRVGENSR